ncbi:MAG: hypothetical protein ACOC8D_02130 [bacterium]
MTSPPRECTQVAADYYADPYVRQRMAEFLGGPPLEQATAVYITAEDASPELRYRPRPVTDLWACLARGLDIGRSLWDRQALVVHLDIDYVNFSFPGEAHLQPLRTFEVQRPVAAAVGSVLLEHGIRPLHLLSGRGHHFTWRAARPSQAFERLAALAPVPESLQGRYAQPHPPRGEVVEPELGAAYAGLGVVMEYLAHRVLDRAAEACPIPVELTAVTVGPGAHGQEIVSVDVSEYGDPLHLRPIRVPFGAYLKPQQRRAVLGAAVADGVSPLFMIPVHEMDERQALLVMRDIGETRALARRASVQIPDQSAGTGALASAYEGSRLRRFHRWFYAQAHEAPRDWPATYDRTPLDALPPCARKPLARPNPLLLKPAWIQHVVRVLLADGWHPRHVAGLIRSKYERDHGWGDAWYRCDATSRADFYVRLFAGLVLTGRDRLVDFNCRSAQEKGFCTGAECADGLDGPRRALLRRTLDE